MVSRRAFLRRSTALGAGALAAGPATLDTIARAGAAVAGQAPETVAQDERYWRGIQDAFTVDRTLVNLNNGSISPSPRVVQEALVRYLDESNRRSVRYGRVLAERVEAARQALAAEFGCGPDELALTRNATEGLHIAQGGVELRAGDEIVTTDQDYPRMLWMWDQRARRDGIIVRRIQFPVPTTAADLLDRFDRALTPRTRVLQFCHITNVTGQVFPVRELSRLARQRGILTIVDGTQAVGHIPFNLRELECDVYATSLHKWLMAPMGTGFLYVRRDRIDELWPLQAALAGMRNDIRKFEEIGTYPAAARAALTDALAFHRTVGIERKAARLRHLTLRWATALGAHPRVRLLSSLDAGQTWGLATFAIDGVNAATLLPLLLDRHGIVVSAAVSQGMPGPVFDFSGVRVTPQVYTTVDEIDRFVAAMRQVLSL
jgi:selenocysteine lyase/cysteine desulfurase